MKVIDTPIKGLKIIEPRTFKDERGYFYEAYQEARYREHGIPRFVQDNTSRSQKNVLRGLHYQQPKAQGKLVGVTRGAVWDVAVDIRKGSSSFGKWFGTELSDENCRQLYIPSGFAHGFCVLSDEADFYYKCTEFYSPETERGICWNDETLKIDWPVINPVLSPKDTIYPSLRDIPDEKLF